MDHIWGEGGAVGFILVLPVHIVELFGYFKKYEIVPLYS